MFLRKKKNKSGTISIQVIDKSSGRYKVIKTLGSSNNPEQINQLYNQGKEWIKTYQGQQVISFEKQTAIYQTINNIKEINISGTTILLGNIYDEIGFNNINSSIFKDLVITKLSHPSSKLKTTDYLRRYYSKDIDEDSIYRYMDKIYEKEKELIQRISYNHTLKILDHKISIVFYDVTTLYFQIDDEDEIRKRGFSKEGKHQNPQILLGLLVSIGGYPLAYEIFEGNKFEGHTMLPVINRFKKKYQLDKLVIIADSGLLSKVNIEELQKGNYEFILGARIKNESKEIKEEIISLKLSAGESKVIEKNELKLIISYSDKRAKKDKYNRERGLKRLEKLIKSGKLTKSSINNRGYNKYLKMEGDIKISIDNNLFEQDSKWDGLKGYLTNTDLTKDEIIENYSELWKIEKAFRISKHDLKIRPIYHRLKKRIEAHITINFAAYKIYKELERQLKEKESGISPEKAIEIAKAIYSIKVDVPELKQTITKTLLLNDEQKYLAELFDF